MHLVDTYYEVIRKYDTNSIKWNTQNIITYKINEFHTENRKDVHLKSLTLKLPVSAYYTWKSYARDLMIRKLGID
jgi:hypothetical protein